MTVRSTDPEAVAAFVRSSGLGVLATVDSAGHPEAALVGLAALDDSRIVAISPAAARKVENIETHPQVALVVGWEDDVTLQVEGTAVIATGDERSALAGAYDAQLPGSRAFRDDFAVICVRPHWVRIYDAGHEASRAVEARWSD